MNTKIKMYKGYRKLHNIWLRQRDSETRTIMLECLNQSMEEIIDQYMNEFEAELYKEVA